MSLLLPLVALALAALSRYAFRDREPLAWRFDVPRIVALVLLALVAVGVAYRFGPPGDRSPLAIGLLAGAVAVLVGDVVGGSAATIGIGVAAAASMHGLAHAAVPKAELALMVGAGLGALALGGEAAIATALAATLCAAADNLGGYRLDLPAAGLLGSEFGLAVLVGTILAGWIPSKQSALKPLGGALLAVVAGFFLSQKLKFHGLAEVIALGAGAGLVLHWLLPDEEGEPGRYGLAVVIGIGVATLAFGLARGTGMACALIAAALVLLGVGNRRAVLTLGPLVGLVMYRVLREAGTGATRALDIGQHYALLGIALGAVLPLLPTDWLRRDGAKAPVGSFLWGLIVLTVPPLVILMLGMKGAVGFVAGLGFTGLCQALRNRTDLLPLALATGMGGASVIGLGWLSEADQLTRDEKVRVFMYAGAGLAVVAIVLTLLTRPRQTTEVPR